MDLSSFINVCKGLNVVKCQVRNVCDKIWNDLMPTTLPKKLWMQRVCQKMSIAHT